MFVDGMKEFWEGYSEKDDDAAFVFSDFSRRLFYIVASEADCERGFSKIKQNFELIISKINIRILCIHIIISRANLF